MSNTAGTEDTHAAQPIADLARLGRIAPYRKGSLIIMEGDAGDTLYVLLSGRIRIFSDGSDGRRYVFGTFGPGAIFGEGSLDGGPRTASVEAIADSECAIVPYASLRSRMVNDPLFAMTLLTELIARGRASSKKLKSLALEPVYQRLLNLIENEAIHRDGILVLGPDLSQQEIANRVGASRDMITKILRELSKGRYIETGRGEIRILKALPRAW